MKAPSEMTDAELLFTMRHGPAALALLRLTEEQRAVEEQIRSGVDASAERDLLTRLGRQRAALHDELERERTWEPIG